MSEERDRERDITTFNLGFVGINLDLFPGTCGIATPWDRQLRIPRIC